MLYTAEYLSPIGKMLLAANDDALCGLWFEGQKYYLHGITDLLTANETPVLSAGKAWLDSYFAGSKPSPHDLVLNPKGTDFQLQIWNLLLEIPYGEVTSYGEIALAYAARNGLAHMSAQAVGGAVGHNPISVIIPCHRVLGANGSLTGYAGGTEKKTWLLTLEGAFDKKRADYSAR